MKRYLHIIILLLTLAFGCLCETSAGENTDMQKDGQTSEAYALGGNKPVDAVWHADGSHKDHGAFIEEPQNIYRICNSRPQRILPVFGFKTGKIADKYHFNYYYEHLVCSIFGTKPRLESSPFQSSASRTYYIIALRHIIC